MCLRIFNFKFVFLTTTHSAGFSVPLQKTYIRGKLAFMVSALEKNQLQRLSTTSNCSLLTSVFTFEFSLLHQLCDGFKQILFIYFIIFSSSLTFCGSSDLFQTNLMPST